MTDALQKCYRHDDGSEIDFELVRSRRRTVGLYVFRDGRVQVRAPMRLRLDEVHHFLRERWTWLQAKRTGFADAPPVPLPARYEDGNRILHLGQWHVLRLSAGRRAGAELNGDELRLSLPVERLADQQALDLLFRRWQRQEAMKLFLARLAHCHSLMQALQLPMPELKLRLMRSRWGSCSSRGVITLNLDLMRMPLPCIDYVIVHELCHLREFHHGPAFYALQGRFLPDWAERKARLNGIAREPFLQEGARLTG